MSKPEQRALVPTLRAGARAKPIMPETFEDVQRIAKMAVQSELFKKASRDERDEVTVARCALAIMTGLDVGLSPAQSVQSIAVINGRCRIYGEAVPGILWAHGFDIEQSFKGDGDTLTAVCTITRPNGKRITREYSVAEAKRARLWDERPTVKKKWGDKWEDKPNDSPWYRFGPRMLQWRALGFAKSDGAADVMVGLDIAQNDDSQFLDVTPVTQVLAVPADIPDDTAQPEAADDVNQDVPEPMLAGAQYLANLEENLSLVPDAETLKEVWDGHLELAPRLTPDDAATAEKLHAVHAKRLSKAKKGA